MAPRKTPWKAALASSIGSVLEYYDFFIYGTAAALVFGKVFFPDSDPATGTLLSFATYGVGYVARPVGAFFMGHLGDRYGRKRVLVLTIVMMGLSTFLVGCLPTYNAIGLWAPALLVALRLMQGFSASGEQSGGNSLTLEHAPDERRSYFSSFTLTGTQAGLVIATAVWLPIGSMPEHDLLTWGWRIPFWLSAIVVVVGVIIRRRLDETPFFEEAAREGEIERAPLGELLRDHLPGVIRVMLVALGSTVSTIFAVYALSFAVDRNGLDKTTMLWVAIVTNVVALAAIPAWATLADRVGRKPVLIAGTLSSGALMFAYLAAIDSHNYVLIFLAAIAMSGVAYSAYNGVQPALYGEMFPTKVRLSGMAIGTQIGYGIGGFAPTAAAAIDGSGWVPVALYVLGFSVIAAVAAATALETFRVPLRQLDERRAERRARPPVMAEPGAAREPVLAGHDGDGAQRRTTAPTRRRP